MGNAIDLTGKRIGMVTVIKQAEPRYYSGHRAIFWECKCDCGKTVEFRTHRLIHEGKIPVNCGCYTRSLNVKDLTGQRFGKLVVLERAESRMISNHLYIFWKCRCDCGKTIEVRAAALTRTKVPTRSCGCLRTHDLRGKKYGLLTVIAPLKGKGVARWECQCECGNKTTVAAINLLKGITKSCGCLFRKTSKRTMDMRKEEMLDERAEAYGVDGTMVCFFNNKVYSNSSSGIKGVTFYKNRWVASLTLRGKKIYLGRYVNLEDAVNARKMGEEMYYKPIMEAWSKENPNRAYKLKKRLEKKA
ncbi:MAG: hypothetical protein MJ110_04665 [Lachnospiraceae bacterium]|nr:hypothetical protein [Lachnospiraceae bacterium]